MATSPGGHQKAFPRLHSHSLVPTFISPSLPSSSFVFGSPYSPLLQAGPHSFLSAAQDLDIDSAPHPLMANNWKRASSLDFSDGKMPPLSQHPDMANPFADNGLEPNHLQRNKSERRRLQPLQRTNTTGTMPATPYRPTGWMERFDVWMINEGGKRLFFVFFILLHILVILFGAFYYGTSDDLVGDRKTFGVTYRMCSTHSPATCHG